jgi:hypothetical protein
MTEGTCRLCREHAVLCESHVLPAFVCRWLAETSLGHVRSTAEPNRRIQDGLKEYWLCNACEERFSKWETPFAELFREFHNKGVGEVRVAYGEWALRFAVSVSWRVLFFFRDKGLQHLSPAEQFSAQRALATWTDFLLDRCDHPEEFQQHLLHLDAATDVGGRVVSPFLNRYLLRTWDLDVVTSAEGCFTYAKLGRVVVFGFIRVLRPRRWKGTNLHVREGVLWGVDCSLPGFLPHYWNDRADLLGRTLNGLSRRQQSKVDQVFRSTTIDDLAGSDAFRAMSSDVFLSGAAAFRTMPGDAEGKSGGG